MGLYIHLLNHTMQDKRPSVSDEVPANAWALRQRILLARYLAFTRPRRVGLLRWWRERFRQVLAAK
ncbi:hypothetical protein [Paludibacterium purpuratum]|uniref:Uncharacterized protein n=1 Tax=Paludibacterium purpuratum TaxID=1144873 RepID=A0A4R7BFZ2_9NEIS|nr:hypothetical protein [Paludibacterium purpuratum]TDR82677.1 hypothetical protein DFP86_10166 [Paludibacterium purpuratum]